jgi:hypothetical protein
LRISRVLGIPTSVADALRLCIGSWPSGGARSAHARGPGIHTAAYGIRAVAPGSLKAQPIQSCVPMRPGDSESRMRSMEVHQAIYGRRAIRAFIPETVDEATVTMPIDAAIQAPSATNAQPWGSRVTRAPSHRDGPAESLMTRYAGRMRKRSGSTRSTLLPSSVHARARRSAIQSASSPPANRVWQ